MTPGGGASQPPTEAQRRAWIRQWRSAAIALDRVRYEELQRVDMGRVAQELEDLYQAARVREASRRTSGLVELQRLLHRRRNA